MNNVFDMLGKTGILPIITTNKAENMAALGEILENNGIPICEVTFRTAAAEDAIRALTKANPQMVVGAGTVLSVEMVKRAVDAGAQFMVTPGLNDSVVDYCVKNNIPITPGCSTPSDIERALQYGLQVVKLFPAEQLGGLKAVKALGGPYSNVKFVITGGVNLDNISEYSACKNVLACGGSWMVKQELVDGGLYEKIDELVAQSVSAVLGFNFAHIGINAETEDNSDMVCSKLGGYFMLPVKKGNSSNFAGKNIEVVKSKGFGKNGHLAIYTNNIERAMFYLEQQGVEFNESSRKFGADGRMLAIYLKEEIAGFAVHLVQ